LCRKRRVAGITGTETRPNHRSLGGEAGSLLILLLLSSARRSTLLIMRFPRTTNAPRSLLIPGSWSNDRTDRNAR